MPSPDPNRPYSYNGDLYEAGRRAEDWVLEYLNQVPGVGEIQDVRDDPMWQRKDVDFIVRFAFGEEVKVEAKGDRHIHKGNVLFEPFRIHHTASPEHCGCLGWSVFSEAERVLVWCEPVSRLYFFEMDALRRGMQRYTHEARPNINSRWISTDTERTTFNIYIPLRYVPHRVYEFVGGLWTPFSKNDQH